jgi:hypothetical protein
MFRRAAATSLTFCAVLWAAGHPNAWGAEDQPQAKEREPSKSRLELMQHTIVGLEAGPDEKLGKAALAFVAKPLLRYSDPTRGTTEANVLLDATVWRLGEKGRPTALVTLEIYRASEENNILAYEFLSLSPAKFSLKHKRHEKVAWEAAGDALQLKGLPGAPKPAASAAARLLQMRQLARKFTAREKIKDTDIQCRLLPQPIDRYHSKEAGILDGAIFVYANGTNPELGVLLECNEKEWSYGIARLSSVESKVELDGKEVASFLQGDFGLKGQGNYVSTSHPISAR